MARKYARPTATRHQLLRPLQEHCPQCGSRLWVASHSERTVLTLEGLCHFTLVVRWCRQRTCPRYHRLYRPEAEGAIALPKGEMGLDVIALVGTLRFADHRSVPEIHRALQERGLDLAQRSVTNLIYRYEELVALSLADRTRLHDQLADQGQVILAIDGLQPDVGHEVLWVLRDCLSGEILLARSLLSGRVPSGRSRTGDLAAGGGHNPSRSRPCRHLRRAAVHPQGGAGRLARCAAPALPVSLSARSRDADL